jgi:hypothetical protein
LRQHLLRNGAQPTACADATLVVLLGSRAIEPLPPHILAHVTAAASSAKPILLGALAMSTTAKVVAGLSLLAILIAGGMGVITQIDRSSQATKALSTSTPAAVSSDDVKAFRAVYALQPGENFKIIPPPFIPQRWPPIWMSNYPAIASQIGGDPVVDCLFIRQLPDGTYKPVEGEDSGGNGAGLPGLTVRELALQCPAPHLGPVRPWQIEGDATLLAMHLPGDVLIRDGATTEQMLAGIADALSLKLGRRVAFTNSRPKRDVVFVSGTTSQEKIHLKISASINSGKAVFPTHASSQLYRMLDYLTDLTGQLFLDQTQNSNENGPVIYAWDVQTADNDDKPTDQAMGEMLRELSDQTGLTFQRELRSVDVWTLAPVTEK